MNEADSEKIAAFLNLQDGVVVSDINKAEAVIINTCSVRQSAEDRVTGFVYNLSKRKPRPRIIVTGCMLRYPLPYLKKKLPYVDKFLKISDLIEEGKVKRKDKTHAWITIIEGCNNFCTYCVVPYARGRERSRSIEEIYGEVKQLVLRGYKQITLLGQNVNSYHKAKPFSVKDKNLKNKISLLTRKYKNNFAVLLALLHEIKNLEKIKFMTSNPHDLDEGIIKAAALPKIDRYLHLAVQSGDDEILKKMNRKYTSAEFLNLVEQIRKTVPDIVIGTDIIVGFPGETRAQFENTVKLCKKADFSLAYISKYSPRPGTTAFKFKDNVSYKEKKKRWQVLNKLINKK
jgi:tRNA-2-methylthio-N6-dimethylallyladenosine synthase